MCVCVCGELTGPLVFSPLVRNRDVPLRGLAIHTCYFLTGSGTPVILRSRSKDKGGKKIQQTYHHTGHSSSFDFPSPISLLSFTFHCAHVVAFYAAQS